MSQGPEPPEADKIKDVHREGEPGSENLGLSQPRVDYPPSPLDETAAP